MLKLISSVVAVTTFITASLNSFIAIPKTMAASYRTTYKIYGDLNSDNKIDIFDVISMRKAVLKGDYDINLDFNCDDAVDSEDLDLLNDYVLGNNTFFDIYLNDDADEDQICDIYEAVVYKSDPDSKDTDGDTLSDYEEVVYSNTSPTNKYTRELSVTDADDDFDEDQLTNKEEMANKTEPLIADTDWDGLNDYDEINVYFTNPLVADTDGDGLSDGSEIKLQLDPNKTATNGVPDGECIIQQTIDADSSVLSSVNIGKNPYELSIDIKTNGDAEKVLKVGKSCYSDVIANDAMLGDSIDIDLQDTSVLEKMVLRFNIDELRTYNTLNKFSSLDEFKGIKRLNIFRYDKEYGMLLPIDTEYGADNDQIYAEVDETGTYCIMDMEIWLDSFYDELPDETNTPYSNGRRPAPPVFQSNTSKWEPSCITQPLCLVFMLQAEGTDSEAFNIQRDLIKNFCAYVRNRNYNQDIRVYVYPYIQSGVKDKWGDSSIDSFYNSDVIKQQYLLERLLNKIEYNYTDDYCRCDGMISKICQNSAGVFYPHDTFVYDFRNGKVSYDMTQYLAEDLRNKYNYLNILNLVDHDLFRSFSIIGLPEWNYEAKVNGVSYEDSDYPEIIKEEILNNNDLFLNVYDTSLSNMIEHFERKVTKYPVYDIMSSTKWGKITLNGELSPYNNIDTDGDGLTDWEEIDISKLKINSDGSIEYPTFDISTILRMLVKFKDTGEYDLIIDSLKGMIYLPFLSDPTKVDSDGDGYTDDVERSRGTDPLSVDLIMEKTFYEYLVSESSFAANTYREKYYDNSVESGSVFLGKTVCAGKPFSIDLYKSAIVDFLDYAYDKQKTAYSNEKLMEIEENWLKAIFEPLDTFKTAVELSNLSEVEKADINIRIIELTEQLERIEKWRLGNIFKPDLETIDSFYKNIDRYNNLSQEVSAEKERLENLKISNTDKVDKYLKRAGIALGAIDVSVSFSKTLEGYMAFSDCIERFELGMEILDLLQDPAFSSDDTMRRAAAILKSYALAAENDVSFALKEALKAGGLELGNFLIHYAAGELKYTKWLEVLISAGDIIFNLGDVSENAEILVAKSFIPNAIAGSFQSGIKFDSKYDIAFYSGPLVKQKAEYLLELIMARRDAESQCVTYYEAFPWFIEWDKSTDIIHAKYNVSTLDNYLDECVKKYKPLLF